MIADMLSNKELNPVVTELFIRDRKLNTSFVFIMQSYFTVPKNITLIRLFYYENSKQRRTSTNFSHSLDIEYKKMYCKTIFFFIY